MSDRSLDDITRGLAQIKSLMTEERFCEFVAREMRAVEDTVAQHKSGGWMPLLTVEAFNSEKGETEIIVCGLAVDFNTHDEKHGIMEKLGRKFYQDRTIPLFVGFSSEAWASRNPQGFMPSLDPKRQEIIAFTASSGRYQAFAHMPLIRDAQNIIQPAKFGEVFDKGETNLLNSFYRGFFEVVRSKLPPPAAEDSKPRKQPIGELS